VYPDVLIKDHLDSQKIKVGSRFYELNQIIKRLKRDIITHNYTQESNDNFEIDLDNFDMDLELEHNQEDNDPHDDDPHDDDPHDDDPHDDDPHDDDPQDDDPPNNGDDPHNDDDPPNDDESYDIDTNSDVSDNSCESEYRRLLSNFGLETVQKNEELKYTEYCVW
jgi:hypothetical protein